MIGRVLVTGGTGKTGSSLVARLQQAHVPHRVASRHSLIPFDWAQPATWDAALEEIAAIYLLAPGTVSNVYPLMQDFMATALRKGVRRLVFLSMAGIPAGGPAHGQVHQWLKENSNDWAVLCPTAFMQNFSVGPYAATILDEDRIYSNTGAGRVPFIDVDDIAASALAALTAPTPLNTEFVLTGGESMSYDRVAELISHACGRRISHVPVSTEAMAAGLIQRGIPEMTAKLLAFGYQTIATGAHDRVTATVQTLTGKAPKTFEAFAKANAAAWRKN